MAGGKAHMKKHDVEHDPTAPDICLCACKNVVMTLRGHESLQAPIAERTELQHMPLAAETTEQHGVVAVWLRHWLMTGKQALRKMPQQSIGSIGVDSISWVGHVPSYVRLMPEMTSGAAQQNAVRSSSYRRHINLLALLASSDVHAIPWVVAPALACVKGLRDWMLAAVATEA